MFHYSALFTLALLAGVSAQLVGTNTAETHPKLPSKKCTRGGSCTTQQTSIVLDSNWRWLHASGATTNCYTDNLWNATACPNPATCTKNCAVDGADYTSTYGITVSGDALTLKFVTKGQYSTNIGSRVYLMASDTKYQMFKLKNQEFTMDVDVSKLPCGLNGAVYFVAMDEDGGLSKYSTNKAGAKYGTGYCDAQCPHDMKFINGEANMIDWKPSESDKNAGTGKYGTCCSEMDIWEANVNAAAYTPHSCSGTVGQVRCEGNDCGDGDNRHGGICDKDGCDFNSFRQGDREFYGVGKVVDTSKKFTVVTQFLTVGNSSTGALREIRRLYVQGGKVIQNSINNIPGMGAYDSITEQFCAEQKIAFGDVNDFQRKGGFGPMGTAMDKGMVLALSMWDDHTAKMLWLDSNYPLDKDPSEPGVARGTCGTDSGVPADVESKNGGATVIYSNIRIGDIGSTYTS